jgi:hypothetical protein
MDVALEFYAVPPIGQEQEQEQEQERPMDGAQFHSPWVGEAGGRLEQEWAGVSGDCKKPLRSA